VAIAGTLLLVFVSLLRPQEFIAALRPLSLLNLCATIAVVGLAFELALGKQRAPSTPQLPWLAAFILWGLLVTVPRTGTEGLTATWDHVGLSTIFMLLVAFSARTWGRLRSVSAMLLGVGALLCCVCIHQAMQPSECIVMDSSAGNDHAGEGAPDGRSCDSAWECERNGKAHTDYACEKVGLFGTFSTGKRVRWRGTLADPNEVAVALAAIMPLSFAFAAVARRFWVSVVAVVILGLTIVTVIHTSSRGGQLVVLTVFGLYFVRRYGWKGLLVGAVVAAPVLLFGGRSGEEAESSEVERLDLLYEGMDMIRAHPFIGVGIGQFVENVPTGQTAHNSYVLACSELGFPGSLLWLMLVYTSMKIPWTVLSRPPAGLDARVLPFALALVASFAGILVGILFLSFCYKAFLFIYFGMSGALYGVVRRSCPEFEVRVAPKEIARVLVAEVVLLAFVLVFSHVKAAHS
jgi:O-antigen ligase